jgi:zinc transporter ZupT
MTDQTKLQQQGLPLWLKVFLPVLALVLILALFVFTDPTAVFKRGLPPAEELTITRVEVVEGGFRLQVYNDGPDPVRITQVLVDDAYWQFSAEPDATIPRLGKREVFVPYPWVRNEAHEITLLSPAGMTFSAEIPLAAPVPGFSWNQFWAYGLIGVFVGVIPVVLGMLWFPALRQLDRRWLEAVLALTLGLLVFLLLDTFLEALELAHQIPNFFQGIPLAVLVGLLTWLLLEAVGSGRGNQPPGERSGVYLAGLIALGIGIHNMGEGLAIGAAFATGEAALGTFLVVGFMLHNITEGVGIAAPLLPSGGEEERQVPGLMTFLWLALLAGVPASLGAWIGGFAFSPVLAVVFFGIGLGAIWQVILEVGALLVRRSKSRGGEVFSWANLAGFALGVLVMYLTGLMT